MKRLFMICFSLVFISQARAASGDEVRNGGGLAEKNFFIAYENLEKYAAICAELAACGLDPLQKKTLADIVAAMPAERKFPTQLIFVSEKEHPGTFIIDNQMKVAKTGLSIGIPIYINTDLIYSKNRFGEAEAMDIPTALATLIHEFGHHVSSLSHNDLDLIGVRVSLFLHRKIQSTPALPWNQTISATVVQGPVVKSFPQILINVGNSVEDVSTQFKNAINCPVLDIPIPILPFPDLQLGSQKALGVIFHNVHWEKFSTDNQQGDYTILGNLTHVCPQKAGVSAGVNSFKARISFSVAPDAKGVPQLLKNSVKIQQSYEPWYKMIHLPFLDPEVAL